MMRGGSLILMLCLLGAANVQAQMYKWVGADGKITYSDVPPPPSAKKLETKAVDAPGSPLSGLPFELAEAARNNPVTLYTGDACPPCNDGRTMLNARGIPFTEKTVTSNEDLARLRQVGGDNNLPLLVVGRNKQKGFSDTNWNSALSAAGYPITSKLPKSYRNPAPAAAVPIVKADKAEVAKTAQEQSTTRQDDVPPAGGNAPPGFRF